uniref:Uncharacterized protein n=1 Tax=viral metagenome TaxID=1070528 RepID=A0A6C0BZM9_9ZZZZ
MSEVCLPRFCPCAPPSCPNQQKCMNKCIKDSYCSSLSGSGCALPFCSRSVFPRSGGRQASSVADTTGTAAATEASGTTSVAAALAPSAA